MANNGNDTTSVRIPGITFGGALQISNTTMIVTALSAVAITLAGMHFMKGMKKGKDFKKEWKRHSPRAVKNKVMRDVMSFASNIHTVGHNLPQIRNVVQTLDGRIKNQIQAYENGDITAQQFDASVRNMYPMVLTELGIPANTIPQQVTNRLDATVDRIADRILEGKLPVKVNFRMYKNYPGLTQLHELGRERALSSGKGHKYGLRTMSTPAGVYFAGWQRPDNSYYGSWIRQ